MTETQKRIVQKVMPAMMEWINENIDNIDNTLGLPYPINMLGREGNKVVRIGLEITGVIELTDEDFEEWEGEDLLLWKEIYEDNPQGISLQAARNEKEASAIKRGLMEGQS